MKRVLTIGALALCTQLSGCFVFVPGSVIGAVSDGVTGSKGENCVTRAAKVGDMVRMADGRVWTVLSLSGTSMRCQDPSMPIRAELAPAQDRQTAMAELEKPLPKVQGTESERTAACERMAAVKPGAPQSEYQPAWAELNRLGMTWRDCKK